MSLSLRNTIKKELIDKCLGEDLSLHNIDQIAAHLAEVIEKTFEVKVHDPEDTPDIKWS